MNPTADISLEAQVAYNAGVRPLDYAEEQIAILLQQTANVARDQATDTLVPLGHPLDVSEDATACRIMGRLMDAGWRAPEWPAQTGEAA